MARLTKLAANVAALTGKTDVTVYFEFEKEKSAGKDLSLEAKWQNWEAAGLSSSFEMQGHDIILIDDLYQSGTTMQFVAMKLQQANAGRILGLSVVKSLRDTDNL